FPAELPSQASAMRGRSDRASLSSYFSPVSFEAHDFPLSVNALALRAAESITTIGARLYTLMHMQSDVAPRPCSQAQFRRWLAADSIARWIRNATGFQHPARIRSHRPSCCRKFDIPFGPLCGLTLGHLPRSEKSKRRH